MTTTTGLRMHPRLRARRLAVERTEGRRRLRRLIALLGVVTVLALAWAALRSPLLDVDQVVVEGARRTGSAAVVAASGVAPGDAMVDVDPAGAEAGVARLPWVAAVEVRREWPGRVHIAVAERRPRAVLEAGEAWVVLDADGRVLAEVGERPAGLPLLGGAALRSADEPPAPGEVVGGVAPHVLAVVSALPAEVAELVEAAVVHTDDDLRLRLVDGGEVWWGPADRERAEKVLALTTVIDRVDLRALATLDLRVPSTPVVTRR